MQNKKELKAKSPLAKTSDEEIARIANDLASLYK
jgi:hypothetical protein